MSFIPLSNLKDFDAIKIRGGRPRGLSDMDKTLSV